MHRLAAVRAAGDGEFAVVKPIGVGGAALDQWNGLQQLHRRARKYRPLDIAERDNNASVRIRDREGAAMHALDQTSSSHLDEDWIRGWLQLTCSLASSIGTPVECFEARMTRDVFTLATFGAAVNS